MNLTSRVEIISNSTSASPRAARLVITGESDEYDCCYVQNYLLNRYAALNGNKEAGATVAAAERQPCNSAMDAISALRDLVRCIEGYFEVNGSRHLSQGAFMIDARLKGQRNTTLCGTNILIRSGVQGIHSPKGIGRADIMEAPNTFMQHAKGCHVADLTTTAHWESTSMIILEMKSRKRLGLTKRMCSLST